MLVAFEQSKQAICLASNKGKEHWLSAHPGFSLSSCVALGTFSNFALCVKQWSLLLSMHTNAVHFITCPPTALHNYVYNFLKERSKMCFKR